MSNTITLEAEARNRVGKGASRELRRNGQIPAVIYGGKQDALPIAINQNEIRKMIYAGGFMTHILDIKVDGKAYRAIPKDYQLDPIKDFPVHVDFLRISKNMTLTVDIPVTFINENVCPGLKAGGVLNIVRHTVEVNCPPDSIPSSFEVDLAPFDLGDTIHISAVALPDGVTPTITDRDFTIATIASPAGLKSESDSAADDVAADDVAVIGEEDTAGDTTED